MKHSTFSITAGNLLYRYCYVLYRRLYPAMKRRHDARELQLLQEHVAPGSTVLDVGANVGFTARVLSACVGSDGCVYAFEPDGRNFAHLKRELRRCPNVQPVHAAVGSETKMVTLYRSRRLNVDHRTYPIAKHAGTEEVLGVAMDEFLPFGTKVSFIKIDVQGAEYAVLQGMKRTLEGNRKRLKMLVELWPAGLLKAGASAVQLFDFLVDAGFKLYLVAPDRLRPMTRKQALALNGLPEGEYFNVFVVKR